jgi:hypothetical protein
VFKNWQCFFSKIGVQKKKDRQVLHWKLINFVRFVVQEAEEGSQGQQ